MSLKKPSFLIFTIAMVLAVIPATAQINRNVNEYQVRTVLERLETRTDTFRAALERQVDNGRWRGQYDNAVMNYIADFENSVDELRNDFNSRRVTTNDVTEVLNYGWYIDDFMRRNQLAAGIERQWTLIRNDLNQLARYYGVSANWYRTTPPYGWDRWENRNGGLTGTYRLNTSMSDNVSVAIDRAIGMRQGANWTRQRQNLERRLNSPRELAIDMRGNNVTLATNLYEPVSFIADGRAQSETNARGRTTRTTVSMSGNTLTVNTEGDRANDFWVSFTPIGTNQLRMTRRIYLENRNQMITVNSVYDRVSPTAQWPVVDRRDRWNDNTGSVGRFYIPNGTRLTAVLRNRIATNVSQAGDPFTMEVTSPSQYRGAIITGRVTELERSGRVTGRANLVMDFDTIRIGGTTYDFAGIIDSAREADGDTISINNEGVVRDGSQTTRTVTRAGIGAALGALIGAIVGGGEGAAIGAGIGAGAGAGTVLIQGRDNIDLQAGSEFSITATGPSNARAIGVR